MPVTSQEFAAFTRFAQQKVADGDAESIEQLAQRWREARRLEELSQAITAGESDVAAGRLHPAEEVFQDVRRDLGLTE